MAWKLKEEYKGHTIPHFRRPLCSLKPHHIKNLSQSILDLYFVEDKPKKSKKIKDNDIEGI
tara:strand:- start:25615 stop:25797 length:183 start_codon:yes stop_codon:yes gene_type:complete